MPLAPAGKEVSAMEAIKPASLVAGFVLLLLNAYFAYHYLRLGYKTHKNLKRGLLLAANLLIMAASGYFYLQYSHGHTQTLLTDVLMMVAGLYVCTLLYAAMLFGIYDIFRLINRIRRFSPRFRLVIHKVFRGGATVFLLGALIAVSGLYPALHFSVNHYDATLPAKSSRLDTLGIAIISDAHIGVSIREKQLVEIKDAIMATQPDLIVLLGDIFDQGTTDHLKASMASVFSGLHAPYGVYYVIGNHDDHNGDTEKQLQYFRDAGITVLTDEVVLVDDAFYLVGRKDASSPRVSFDVLDAQIVEDLPVIVLDHQPRGALEVQHSTRADLQLSGHTHNGQFVPAHIMVPFNPLFGKGFKQVGGLTLFISTGVGNFDFPFRIGSMCEIAHMTVLFA